MLWTAGMKLTCQHISEAQKYHNQTAGCWVVSGKWGEGRVWRREPHWWIRSDVFYLFFFFFLNVPWRLCLWRTAGVRRPLSMHHSYTIHFISPSPFSRSRLNLSACRFKPRRRCMFLILRRRAVKKQGESLPQRYLNNILKMHKERPWQIYPVL